MGFGGGSKVSQAQAAAVQATDESDQGTDAERLKRVGRAALIATSSRGVLGNPQTGRRQLTAV